MVYLNQHPLATLTFVAQVTCVGYSFLIIVNISSVLYLFNKRTVNPSITARKITLSPEI